MVLGVENWVQLFLGLEKVGKGSVLPRKNLLRRIVPRAVSNHLPLKCLEQIIIFEWSESLFKKKHDYSKKTYFLMNKIETNHFF